MTGLNFLLNEQPDKAIDAFIEAVKIDNQTVELHFALGSLFRRRGETDRAIHAPEPHRSRDLRRAAPARAVRARPGFLKAGLLDRAEAVFVKMRGTASTISPSSNPRHLPAGEGLEEAIEIAEALPHVECCGKKGQLPLRAGRRPSMANSRFDEAMEGLGRACS